MSTSIKIAIRVQDLTSEGFSSLLVDFQNNPNASVQFVNYVQYVNGFYGETNVSDSGYASTQIPDGVSIGEEYRITFDYDYSGFSGGVLVRITGSVNGATITQYPSLPASTNTGSYDETITCTGNDSTAYILFSGTIAPGASLEITNFKLYRL